jgi:hypothetical protein
MSIVEIDNPESPALVLGPKLAGTLMSPGEFDSVADIDDTFVYELIHGVLIVPLDRLLEVADRWKASKHAP